MNIAEIEKIGSAILKLRDAYHNPPSGELSVDRMMFSYLWPVQER